MLQRNFICLFIVFGFSAFTANADSYGQVLLKYRDAASVATLLAPLLNEALSLAPDGRRLLLRGPDAEIKQLITLIKAMDKPLRQLKVSIYRGKNSHLNDKPFHNKNWSTNSGKKHRLDSVVVSEDSTLLITDTQLLRLPIENYRAFEKETGTDGTESTYKANSEYKAYGTWSGSIRVTPTLIKDDQVSIRTITSMPPSKGVASGVQHKETAFRSIETNTARTVLLNQWTLLSFSQELSERPPLKSQRQVFSTHKQGEFDDAIWIKFELSE